eukprot:181239_1
MSVLEHLDSLITTFRNPQSSIHPYKASDYNKNDLSNKYQNLKAPYHWVYGTYKQTLLHFLKLLTINKQDLEVIDIACGDGNVSRFIIDNQSYLNKRNINVIGIDISSYQINLAISKSQLNKYVQHIQYENISAQHVNYVKKFDVAVIFFCFNYSQNKEELKKMMMKSYECLKDDGIIIGTTCAMNESPNVLSEYYDVHKNEAKLIFQWSETIKDGDKFSVIYCAQKEMIHLDQYFYYHQTYEKIAKQIGFKNAIKWLNGNDFIYDSLNDEERKISQEYFANPQPFPMFILKK